jgi:hypothetical protein
MRLPRMTTRRWIGAVAVVGLLMGAIAETIRELRLAREYRARASTYGVVLRLNRGERVVIGGVILGPGAGDPTLAAYSAEMERKCVRAAHYPWLPVEPDPRPPDP